MLALHTQKIILCWGLLLWLVMTTLGQLCAGGTMDSSSDAKESQGQSFKFLGFLLNISICMCEKERETDLTPFLQVSVY